MRKLTYADSGEPVVAPFMGMIGSDSPVVPELAAQVSGRVIQVHEPEDEGRSYSQFDFGECPDSDIEARQCPYSHSHDRARHFSSQK